MATVEHQKVKFTGKMTGLESIALPRVGRVRRGQTVEVTKDEADNWTTKRPYASGMGADFVKVGGPVKVDEAESLNRRMSQREKLASDTLDEDSDVNDEMAHPIAEDTGTVEEYAEVVTAEPEAADNA